MAMAEPLHRDTATDFERALSLSDEPIFVLRLCVSGMTPRSQEAIRNLRILCDTYLPSRYSLEVIDIYQQPELAAHYDVVATPMLIKEAPAPLKRLLGSLRDMPATLARLGIILPVH